MIFVTGTDTGVGKTLCCAMLLAAHRRARYWKPIQTGDDDDTTTVRALAPAAETAPPCYRFALPAAPSRAARAEGARIELDAVVRASREIFVQGPWVVEGAGGLLVPLNERETTRELISALALPILLVSSTRLGTINHTLLTLECAREAGLEVRGVVLSGPEDPGLEETLVEHGKAPILARIPGLADISASGVERASSAVFPGAVLRRIFEGPEA